MKTLLYLHGFASSPQGSKATFLRNYFNGRDDIRFEAFAFTPTPRDFEFLTVSSMIGRLRQYLVTEQFESLCLIGSSMGGLVATNYVDRYGGVEKLMLLAPALKYLAVNRPDLDGKWARTGVMRTFHYAYGDDVSLRYGLHVDGQNYLQPAPAAVPTQIIHGRGDDVVPLSGSEAYAAQYPDLVELIPRDSDHGLTDQSAFIAQQIESFLI